MNVNLREILDLDSSIRYVELLDSDGHGFSHLTRNNLQDETEHEEIWRYDTVIALRIAELQTSIFGELICVQTTREKVNQIIFYVEKQMIYVTFDSMDSKKNLELSCKLHNYIENNLSQKLEAQ